MEKENPDVKELYKALYDSLAHQISGQSAIIEKMEEQEIERNTLRVS